MPPPALNPRIFRAYDIRGIARGAPDDELTPALAERIGRGFATYLRELGSDALSDRRGTAPCVIVGRDSRPTSPALYAGVIAGLRAAGADVTGIGLAPTPVTGWAASGGAGGGGFDGAVSVTASHNPVEFNGFKLLREQAMPLLPDEIDRVRELVESGAFASGAGAIAEGSPHRAYVEALGDRFRLKGTGLRVVADPGNGVATLVGPAVLGSMGVEVIGLYTELAAGFPHHVANPQDASTMVDLASRVVAEGADLGVAWDGDGDRMGVVDERGRRYEADWIVALLARDVLRRRPGATILLDMKTSRSAIEDIEAHGGQPVLTRTGYSMFRRQMRDEGIVFGGEASGHIMFGEDYPFLDDGIYAAAAVAKVVAESGQPLSAHFATMRRLVTSPELGLPCPDEEKFAVAAAVARAFRGRFPVSELDGARIEFDDGWAHVRASNTNPYLSVRFEAETPEGYRTIRALLWEALQDFPCVTIPEGAGEPL